MCVRCALTKRILRKKVLQRFERPRGRAHLRPDRFPRAAPQAQRSASSASKCIRVSGNSDKATIRTASRL